MSKRAAIYLRVSSEMQLENYSLDAQENACRAFCQLKGWQIAHVYKEMGKSAKDTNRPEFQCMMKDAQSGMFDFLVVWKLDRFSRSVKDSISQIELLDSYGIGFASVTEQFDFSTPHGKLMLSVLSGVAEWYRNNLAQEISKGKRQRAKAGDWNGTLSYGYTTPKLLKERLLTASSEDAQLIEAALTAYPDAHETQALPCPFNASAVVLAFEAYASGSYSYKEVAELLNSSGYRCQARDGSGLFSKEMIAEALKNRFYLGETSYGSKVTGQKREWIAGNHKALINEELFNKVQAVIHEKALVSNKSAHNRKRPYPLSPMIYCLDIGQRWVGTAFRGVRHYVRKNKGTAAQLSINADYLENEIVKIIADIKIPEDWKQAVIKAFAVKSVSTNPKQLNDKLDRLKHLYVLGDISETDYLQQRTQLKNQLKQSEASGLTHLDDMEIIVNLLRNFQTLWENATLEEKDMLMKMLVSRVYMRDKSITAIEPTSLLWELIAARGAGRIGLEPTTSVIIPYGTEIEHLEASGY